MAPHREHLHGVNVQGAWLGMGVGGNHSVTRRSKVLLPLQEPVALSAGTALGVGGSRRAIEGCAEDKGLCPQGLRTARSGDQGGPKGSAA